MVFCRGCGKEIHETAPTCPHCGAVQNAIYTAPAGAVGLAADSSHPGFWLRVVAFLIDTVVQVIAGAVVGLVLGVAIGVGGGEADTAGVAGNVLGLIVGWLYFAFFESSHLQATPGKLALGIVVTDLNGQRIGFWQATGRHFGKIVSALILLIGYVMCAFTARKQCLHDMMAGCLLYRKA